MPEYRLVVRYENMEAFEEYDQNIEQTIKDKFGEAGAEDFKPIVSARCFPPIHFTAFEAPDDVSLDDLQKVTLGDGVATDVQSEDN